MGGRRALRAAMAALLCLLLPVACASLPVPELPPGGGAETSPVSEQLSVREPDVFTPSLIPPYNGSPWAEVHGGVPWLRPQGELVPYAQYSDLDELGRCGPATACISRDDMPLEERTAIGMIRPSGWQTVRYDDLIEDRYLYNRCHLIAFQLTGENALPENLITGTRFFNTQGMLPLENQAASYLRRTGNHILYRVTPVFEGEELVARGVLMEALSLEDGGAGLCLCAFAYNVQPGIVIDYATGESARAALPPPPDPDRSANPTGPPLVGAEKGTNPAGGEAAKSSPDTGEDPSQPAREGAGTTGETPPEEVRYIGNRNSLVFHRPDCASLPAERNRVLFSTREEAVAAGFRPCGGCKP